MVEAHILEEKTAIYPRVVLSHQFNEYAVSKNFQVLQDFDGTCFVDYVSTVNKLYPDWIVQIKSMIKEQYTTRAGKTGQESILQKYGWLQHYIEQCEINCTETQSV